MHLIAVLFALIFSTSHAASVQRSIARHSEPSAFQLSERTPSRAEISHIRAGGVYAGTECMSCLRTNVSFKAR
jgi:hypothetical protein